jgi:hypothetical protein
MSPLLLSAWPPDCQEASRCGTSTLVVATLFNNNGHEPLLELQKSLILCLVPVHLKFLPHDQTILEVWQNHTIIKGEKEMFILITPWP